MLPQRMRSKQYSSITAATAFLPFSSNERTTRPVQFTWTSVSVPSTEAGKTMRKRITVPTPSRLLVWNSTPPAEISAVSAKYSWASAVRTVMGSLRGKRTELLVSAGPKPATGPLDSFTLAPLNGGYTCSAHIPRLLWYSVRTKGHTPEEMAKNPLRIWSLQ